MTQASPLLQPQVELFVQVSDALNLDSELCDQEKWQAWLQTWAEGLMHQPEPYELTLRFTDDLELQALNTQFRQISRPTDVLAFTPFEITTSADLEEALEELCYLGDIVISVETAQVQANDQDHSLLVELAWLACHGFLHLLGWDHPDEASLEAMIKVQKNCLEQVGLSLSG